MAVAFRAESHLYGFTAANVVVTEPTGTAQNDVLILMLHLGGASTGSPAAPTGWTTLYSGTSTQGSGSDNGFKFLVSYIVRGASAPSLTCSNGSTFYGEWNVLGFSGCSTSSPIDSQSASGALSTTSSGNFDPPATTAVSSSAMAVCGGLFWDGSATAWAAPTGYTIRSTVNVSNDQALASKLLSASGSENPAAFSGAAVGTADIWQGFTITLAPSGGAAPSPAPKPLVVQRAALNRASAF